MQDSGVETPEGNGIMGSRRAKAHPIQMLKCPRCDSLNTKFCYYNNYNLAQPRHFCKNCRRYWTKGGALRNVPVGGGCRKNKRSTKQLRKVCPTNLGGSSGAGPSATVHQRGSDTGFDSHCDIGTDNPAIATSGTSTDAISGLNFTGISASVGAAGSLDFQLKQDQLLLLGNFIDANSYSVNESGYFPLSDPATSAVNWNAVDSRKGFGLSEMQRKQTSLPHGDVQPAASIKIEEGEEASRVVMGNAPALSLWDAEGGNGIFPYNFDYNGEALLEMQIGDLGCWGGGGW